jgi:glycogen phosphorylase
VTDAGTDTDPTLIDLGGTRTVKAEVHLGSLDAGDVRVELLHGPVGMNDELGDFEIVTMTATGPASAGTIGFEGTFACGSAGRHGYTVRVVPANPDLVTWAELGCVTWA